MRKPLMKKPGAQFPLAEMDPKAFEKAPFTRGFFMDAKFAEDETPREPGMIILRPESNRWTVTLKDPASCSMIFLAANTWSDLWKLVEAVLGDDQSPWVEDKWQAQRQPKARQKRS